MNGACQSVEISLVLARKLIYRAGEPYRYVSRLWQPGLCRMVDFRRWNRATYLECLYCIGWSLNRVPLTGWLGDQWPAHGVVKVTFTARFLLSKYLQSYCGITRICITHVTATAPSLTRFTINVVVSLVVYWTQRKLTSVKLAWHNTIGVHCSYKLKSLIIIIIINASTSRVLRRTYVIPDLRCWFLLRICLLAYFKWEICLPHTTG